MIPPAKIIGTSTTSLIFLALIVLREEFKSLDKEEILKFLAQKFAKWQLPDKILFIDSIPKTSVGKHNKQALRIKYKELYTEI